MCISLKRAHLSATGPSAGPAEPELGHGRGPSTQSLLSSSSEDTQHVVRLGQCCLLKAGAGWGLAKAGTWGTGASPYWWSLHQDLSGRLAKEMNGAD